MAPKLVPMKMIIRYGKDVTTPEATQAKKAQTAGKGTSSGGTKEDVHLAPTKKITPSSKSPLQSTMIPPPRMKRPPLPPSRASTQTEAQDADKEDYKEVFSKVQELESSAEEGPYPNYSDYLEPPPPESSKFTM